MDDHQSVHSVEGSFEDFFTSEYRQVLGLAFVLSGSWPAAEDLTMDAFERALKHWPRVSRLEAPGAWVRKVVSNSVVSRFRRLGAENRARSRLEESQQPEAAAPEGSEVWSALRRLPARQAQAMALFYFSGYTRREVAGLLEISEESVKTHLERGRRRLEQELGGDGRS